MLENLKLPSDYLEAIGRVAVYYNYMDSILNILLVYVCGMEIAKDESHVIFAHMAFGQKLDILASIGAMRKPHTKYNLAEYKTKVQPLLKTANTNRNKIIHGMWGMKNGSVTMASITARGELKFKWDTLTLKDIEKVQHSIEVAIVGLGTIVSKESFSEAIKPPQSGQKEK